MSFVPNVGMAELFLLGMLALVVVGPKELPRLMRTVGRGFAKARGLASEFRAGIDQMAREAEIDEMRKEIEALKAANPATAVRDAVNSVEAPLLNPTNPTNPRASEPASADTPAPSQE